MSTEDDATAHDHPSAPQESLGGAAGHDLKESPDLAQTVTFTAMDVSVTELSLTETDENASLPQVAAPTADSVVVRQDPVHLVPVEPLMVGIGNALADAVGQVVQAVAAVRKTLTPSGIRTTQKHPPKKPKVAAAKPAGSLPQGIRRFIAGVEGIAQNGVQVVTGVAGCLQGSFHCIGQIIMNPAHRPHANNKNTAITTSRPVSRPPAP